MNNDSSIKFKIGLAYLILFSTTVFSGWYIYKQIDNISLPKKNVAIETNRIFILSEILTNVFASETSARIAMISTKNSDIARYEQMMDSIQDQLSSFKLEVNNPNIIQKLDSIEMLLIKKDKSFQDIVSFRKKHMNSQNFNVAFDEIRKTKKDIDNKTTTVPDSLTEKKSWWNRMITSSKTREKNEKAKEAILRKSHEAKRDSFAKAAESIFTKAVISESKITQQYLKKEEQLLNENKNITQKIRSLFVEVEQNILAKSNENILESKSIIDQTANNLIWSGSISFILVFILGIIVIKDLNKNFTYKRKLEELNANMQELIKQKNFFFASITHDIVSPLNSIIGFSNLLEDSLTHEKQKEYLQNINHSSQYIHNLVSDLVDFSKLEHNKLVLKKESFDFAELIHSIVLPLENEAKKKNITLTTSIDDNLHTFLYSDAYRIRQIVINLLTNAIKFTHQGGVTLHATQVDQLIELTISDTGIGIDPKYQHLIFNEFQQAHGGIEKVYGGTGLGLNITKRLVEMLEGTIAFESELEKGTTFKIRLPFVQGEHNLTLSNPTIFKNNKLLINKKILVIDDDPIQLKLMREILLDKVHTIDTIENGKELDQLLEQHLYDLIITDIQMPNYSGYSIVRDIQKHQNYKDIPVIAFTGKTDLDENEYYQIGFQAVISKPIQMRKLISCIHQVLEINMVPNSEPTPKSTGQVPSLFVESFDLSDLLTFTENDWEVTLDILRAFTQSSYQSIEELHLAIQAKDQAQIQHIAHRMLPMFRQLKMKDQVQLLEKLEREADKQSMQTVQKWVQTLEKSTLKVLKEIEKIELT